MEDNKIEFRCLDSYEAEKLTSIFSKQKDESMFVSEIVKMIDSEIVVKLRDGSHHSILLKNLENAKKLFNFFGTITEDGLTVLNTHYDQDRAIFYFT
jgi:hypothetical protein